jgi:polyhydroxybutyrate depolymerase
VNLRAARRLALLVPLAMESGWACGSTGSSQAVETRVQGDAGASLARTGDASAVGTGGPSGDDTASSDASEGDPGEGDGGDSSAAADGPVDAAPGTLGSPAPAPVATGCVTDVTAGHRVVPCNGITHNLTVPAACLTQTCGLIVDVHGGTMSADMEDKNTQLAEIAPPMGFIVVQPNANNGLWDATTDDPLVYGFIQDVRDAFHVDTHHIHMTGISQGGYMSWRFACAHTDLFGSVAPAAAAGQANISVETGCTFTGTDVPSGELDILYMHGTQDGLVNFPNAIVLRDAVRSFYDMDDGTVIATDGTFTRTRYKTPSGRVFEFIQHNYVTPSMFAGVAIKGHCFPGSQDQSVTLPNQLMSFGCDPPDSFTWGQEVLAFFLAHPKP